MNKDPDANDWCPIASEDSEGHFNHEYPPRYAQDPDTGLLWMAPCGAFICDLCGHHKGLARCFCGWAADGGDGYAQLEEMGEQIEDLY